jgi:TnpA family transposase
MVFFKPDGRSVYPHIDSLFSENINYSLITDNYKDMLRVAVSISEGKVSASTMIRRLGSNSIRNSLFYAFRELGRVVRTQFLLQYISEIELRESVHAATCKSEEFNQFVQWVFFYNSGMIQENLRYAQDKMIAYNHLVANLVILHNVDSMSKAINKLKRQGFNADAEALRSLSPYRTEHINLLGTYSLKIPKQQGNRNFKLM